MTSSTGYLPASSQLSVSLSPPAAWIGAPNNVAVALEGMRCDLAPSTQDHEAESLVEIEHNPV